MNGVLNTIYSAEFFVGAVSGAVMMKLYQWHHCRHLDKVAPLPGGRRRHVPGINIPVFGAVLSVLALGYVLFQTQETEERYKGLADRVSSCQVVFQSNIAARSAITTENDRVSILQRDKLSELDTLTGQWIDRLLNPPPHLVGTTLADPGRQGYTLTVTRIYQEQASRLRADINALRDEATKLAEARAAHPIPDPTC